MYEKDGHMYSLEEVQAAADKNQLSLEEYITSRGLKLTSNEKKEAPKGNHISREEFEYGQGKDVEKNLLKKLKEQYKDKDFNFETSWDGRDEISVTNARGTNQKFYLDSDYNRGNEVAGSGRFGQSTPNFASYDDFIGFLDSDDSTPEQKYIYKKTGLTPETYSDIESGKPELVYDPKMDKMRVMGVTSSKADDKTQKEILNAASTELTKVYNDPQSIGLVNHPLATNATFTEEEKLKIHDHVFETIKNKTGINITRDSYMKLVGQKSASGLSAQLKDESDRRKSTNVFSQIKTDSYKKSTKNLKEQEDKKWVTAKSKGGKNWANKVELNKELQKVQIEIKKLEETLENDPNANKESIVDQIDAKELEKGLIIDSIKKEATRKRYVKMDPKDVGRFFDVTDEDVMSLGVGESGYREQSLKNIENSRQTTKNTLQNEISNMQASDPSLNDYEAQVLLQQKSYIYYENLLKEGNNKKITFDLSDYNRRTRGTKGGTVVNPYDTIIDKIKETPHLELGKDGKIDLSYNDLHSLGFSSRHFDGFFDTFKNNITEKDKDWIRVHEEALDNAEGKRYALWELTDLNIDPEKITKKGPLASFVNATAKTTATEVFGIPEHRADKLVAGFSGKSFTTRYTLDKIKEIEPYVNQILKEEIESGKVQKFEFTKEQAENLERTMTESVAEGVGHFVPTLVKLGVISSVTGGVMSWTGAAKVLQKMSQSKNMVDKLLFHGSMLMLEEVKMGVAGFKPTSGAAFYTGGVLTRGLTPFAAGGKFAYMEPIWQKVVKGGPVGAASMEFASITELWYDDLMENRDFKSNFNDMFGDMDEVTKRLIINSLVFGIIGASHVKKMDFYSTGGKFKAISDLEFQKQEILGQGQKGRNKKYENLTEAEQSKYDGYTRAQSLLNNQIQIETMVRELDPKSKDFQKNFQKRYTDPLNKAIKKVIPTYEGFTVKFYEGGNAWRKRNWQNPRNSAEFRVKAREVAIDKSMYTAGKEIHEFTHAAFRAVFDANPGLKMNFTKNMSKLFEDYDNLPGTNVKLTDAIKTVIRGKEGKEGDLRTKESKQVQAEEFIAYMTEFLSNPNVYYNTVSTNLAKDIKQEITDIFEENFGYEPKIKNAGQFVDFLGRLAIGSRRGTNIEAKAGRMAKLDKISWLGLKEEVGKKETVKALASREIVAENKVLSDKLFEARKEGKEELVRGIEGRLFEKNQGIIEQYINDKFDRSKGGDRFEFQSAVYEEVTKLLKTYKPDRGEFGAYLVEALYGGGGFGGGRTGAIFENFNKGRLQNTVSIDADGSFLQLEGGISAGGSVGSRQAEIGLVNLKNKLELTDAHIKSIENKIDIKNVDKYNYSNLQDLAPGTTMEMFGGRADVVAGESSKNVKQKVQYIADKWKTLYDLLPHGAMLKTGKTQIEGLSTNIKDPLLNGLLYTASSRKGEKAEASAAKTGKTSGLEVQNKIKGLTQKQFLEKFGIFLEADGLKVDFTKTRVKAQSKAIRSIDALISETGRAITNQTVRNYLEKNYEANPQLAEQLSVDALLNQIKGGKSTSLASRNLYDLVEKIGGNAQKGAQLINMFIRNRKGLLKSNPNAYGEIKDLIETRARVYAEQGKSADQFMKSLKGTKFDTAFDETITLADGTKVKMPGYHKLSDSRYKTVDGVKTKIVSEFRSNAWAVRRFEKAAYDLAKNIPAINILKQSGNTQVLLDLFTGHYSVVGSVKAKVNSAFKNGIKDNLASSAAEMKLSPELVKRWENFDWTELKGSYASSFRTGYKKIMQAGTIAQQRAIAKEYFSSKEGKIQTELYDIWNSTLQEWLYTSKKDSKEFNRKASYILKIKKANGAIGTTGERVLAPSGYIYLPGKAFDGTIKYEHLKSSSEQSFESAMLILDGKWTTKGKKSLAKYRGIYGLLSDFNMVDKATGRVNNSDIYRFADNLELAKNIYRVDGKFKTSLYQDIVSKVGKEQVKNLENFSKNDVLDKVLENGRTQNKKPKGISVFDFDQTLANTKEKVKVTMPGESLVYNASPKTFDQLGKRTGLIFLATDIKEAQEYAKSNRGKVREISINDSSLATENQVLDAMKKLNIDTSEGLLYEMIDSRFKDFYIGDANLNKLKKALKQRGFGGFKYNDGSQLSSKGTESVAIIDKSIIKQPTKINAAKFARDAGKLTEAGAKFDFTSFEKVAKGTQKGPLADLALKRAGKFGTGDIFILTARPQSAAPAIRDFMKSMGIDIPLKNITGLENGSPEAKAEWVKKKASEGYNDFYFADDAIKNVKAVSRMLNQIDVKSDVQQALASRDLNKDFNDIIEKKSGIASHKIYSRSKGQVQGANKGRFKFWIPPSAEDFMGLIYPTLAKGKAGDAQMAWYKKNLLDPFARGENAITRERSQLMRDFHALKKEIKDVPKGLRTMIEKGPAKGYTNEQAMRVYMWNKQGMKVPELTKTDLKQLLEHVNSNNSLREFADKLILINKGDGYTKPGSNWLSGTITTDLIDGLNTTKRQRHLKEWIENKNIIFSKENLNKYEAAFGKNGRAALENILQRMESGMNRKKLGGVFQKLENEVLDWTNNSVGAIMFLNSRSAVLQTISAINYINFRDNNPLAAAKAFANQPQFWKDFNYLFNSEYLTQRRDGLKININEAEIAEMAETGGGPKAALAYLLKKGFVMTRHADSFAIASGGASMYRNRINAYKKQGLSENKAKEKAFLDWRELTEEAQQSSRPDRISAQQASGLGRVVLAFANTPMQYARLQKRAIQDLYNGRGDAKTNLSKITYYGFVQNLIFNALQQAFFAIGFDEDPEDQKQIMNKSGRLINGMLDSQLRGLGYGGAAVATVKNVLHKISEEHAKDRPKFENASWEFLDFSPPISSKVTKVRSAMRSLDYDLDEMKTMGFSLDNPAYMAGGNLLSATVNLPVDRVIRKMTNVKDAMDEDNEMWAKVALLAGWNEWELGLEEDKSKSKKKTTKKRKDGKTTRF